MTDDPILAGLFFIMVILMGLMSAGSYFCEKNPVMATVWVVGASFVGYYGWFG